MKRGIMILLATMATIAVPAAAQADSDNCGDIKRDLESQFRVVRYGPSCQHPDTVTAEAAGLAACAAVLAAGGIVAQSGHRTVRLQKSIPGGSIGVNVYLGYCAGN